MTPAPERTPSAAPATLAELLDGLDRALARPVFMHSSWTGRRSESYERLAFLGDSVLGLAVTPPPRDTALGSLLHYITHGSGRAGARYEPVNMTFDLLPPLPDPPERDRRQRHRRLCGRALEASAMWRSGLPGGATPRLPPPLAACVEARA